MLVYVVTVIYHLLYLIQCNSRGGHSAKVLSPSLTMFSLSNRTKLTTVYSFHLSMNFVTMSIVNDNLTDVTTK